MPFSTDVIVSKPTVEFPRRCVVCDADHCQETTAIRANPSGLYGFLPWLFGRGQELSVPAHRECGAKLRGAIKGRLLSLLIFTTGIAVVAALAFEGPVWVILGWVLAALAAPIGWQMIRPLPFEFVQSKGQFRLMFKNADYAQLVASLNDGELDAVRSEEQESNPG